MLSYLSRMYDSIRLQQMLMEAQGKDNNNDRIRPYTASSRFAKDVDNLSKIGMTSEDISYSLSVPITFIQKQKQKIWKANVARRRFLATGRIPQQNPGVFTIFQR